MRKWGGPITLYVAVVLIATVGISVGPDHDKWWVPLLGGFVIVPVLFIVIGAVIEGLDALWGYKGQIPPEAGASSAGSIDGIDNP